MHGHHFLSHKGYSISLIMRSINEDIIPITFVMGNIFSAIRATVFPYSWGPLTKTWGPLYFGNGHHFLTHEVYILTHDVNLHEAFLVFAKKIFSRSLWFFESKLRKHTSCQNAMIFRAVLLKRGTYKLLINRFNSLV